MINTLKIFKELSQSMDSTSANKIAEVIGMVYEELQNAVTRVEFNELKEIVRDLAEAQKRTEARVEELAEAQKRTEVRLEELAEAQKRTEARLEELAEAQKRTEVKVEELAEAQKRTEAEIRTLTITVKNMQKELGGISNTIGYELEDRFYHIFPAVLKEDFNIEVKGEMERRFIIYPSGREDEINIYGEGVQEGHPVYVIGESKAQIGKQDVRDFVKLLERVKGHFGKKIIPLFLCYSIHPHVENYIKEDHPEIKIYRSYELSRKMRTVNNKSN